MKKYANMADCLDIVNFTAYTKFKEQALKLQPHLEELPSYQHLLLGLVSGAMGPLSK